MAMSESDSESAQLSPTEELEDELKSLKITEGNLLAQLETIREYAAREDKEPIKRFLGQGAAIRTYPCGKPRCVICDKIDPSTTFQNESGKGEVYGVKQLMTCKTKNMVYLIKCTECRRQYVGKTTESLSTRMSKRFSEIAKGNSAESGAAAHFVGSHAKSLDSFKVMGIEALKDDQGLNAREKLWINTLESTMNKAMT